VGAAAVAGRAWLAAQGLAWTYDFVEAEKVGLGIRIDLNDFSEAVIRDVGFPWLVVVGVTDLDRSAELEELLEAHRYTRGVEFIPQGTPTNTTETSAPGLSLESPDLAALRAAELDAPPPAARPSIDVEGDLYRRNAADAASIALGLGRGNPLDRTKNAALAELPRAEAMNRLLWPALAGNYLDHMLDGVVSDEGRAWLRDWSVLYARGGGVLPTLLVGSQPYGLLPVSLVALHEDGPAGNLETVEDVLALLRDAWAANISAVPRLDPDATDVAGDAAGTVAEQVALVSQVMGSVPHPTAFRLQQVEPNRSYYWTEWIRRLTAVGLGCATEPGSDGKPRPDYHDTLSWPYWLALNEDLDAATTSWEQSHALSVFADALDLLYDRPSSTKAMADHFAEWRDYTREQLVAFVDAHSRRTDPLLGPVGPYLPDIHGMMGSTTDPNSFFTLHPPEEAATWELPLVAAGRTEAEVAELRDWLADLAAAVDGRFGHAHDFSVANPLLRTLVRWSVENALDPGDQAALKSGLTDVAAIAAEEADPVPELERLLRETLGVHSYRLDAWYTAVAAWRLENKRQQKPHGVQVGAFGVLEYLKPRPTDDPSQGYVLAPSLTHAATAAVLRSGWTGLGAVGESGGLAVNLSSDRVRRARWLVDGVREGQDLGRLLGARFERGLHDATPGLDEWIDDFRQVALTAVGRSAPPNGVVDGLLLARAWSRAEDLTGEEQAALDGIEDLLPTTGTDRPGIEAVLGSLADDLDAVADAALAQSVFSLVQGNVPEATATLTASATGEVTFPELRFADTPRPAQLVTHRLLLLLDPAARSTWPGVARSGRAIAAPALEAWVAGLLGDPARATFAFRFDDPISGAPVGAPIQASLAEVGLAALDLVYLAPVGEQTGLGRLGDLLRAWAEARRPKEVAADAVVTLLTGDGDPSLDNLAVACRQLRRLVAEARDLDGRDLASPGAADVPSGLNADELQARVTAVRTALRAGRARIAAALPARQNGPPRGDVRAAMLSLAGFTLGAGVPRATDPAGLVAAGTALVGEIDARIAAYDALVADGAEGWPDLDEVARHAALSGGLAGLLGHALPFAPSFAPANAAALDTSFDRPRLASRAAATGWLAAAGRVDPGARRLRIAIDLVEAAADAVRFDFSLGQLPDVAGEGWVALERPGGDERGRLCLLATGARRRFADGPAAGLVLGTWTEAVPREHQTAGLAVHFDSPSARAPQAVLLCTTTPERGFDFELVRRLVKQTVDLAHIRMIGPETLDGMGQFLPAAYLSVDTTALEVETA
jgi:hypothetical protein